MCDCLSIANAELATHNLRLVTGLDEPQAVVIETAVIDPKARRGRVVCAAFCPFCGSRYAGEERG
ncbi:MAG: hypothetical protein ACXW3D_01215 [Caulobacteraceae bacterium]